MKIIKQTPDELFETDTPGAPRFRRFEAAFGWMDANAKEARKSVNALMVGGEQEDGKLVVFEEYVGNLPEIINLATDTKDRLWLKRVWVPRSRKDILVQLKREMWAEGLCFYRRIGKDPFDRDVYEEKEPEERWENFRSFTALASLNQMPEHVSLDPGAAWNRLVGLVSNGDLIIHKRCLELDWCRGQKVPADILDHPVVVAAVNLVWALETFKVKTQVGRLPKKSPADPWGNLERGA